MAGHMNPGSKTHDLLAILLGAFAAGVLISSPWQVDTSGPYPFYKGALIFPLMALSLMVLASLPAVIRMLKPTEDVTWHLDGRGLPLRPIAVLGLLIAFLIGIPLIGLEVSSLLFMGITLYFLGHRSVGIFIGIPLILTAVNSLIFKYMLDVFFPTPLLLEWLGG